MSARIVYILGGVAGGLLVLWLLPNWLAFLVILGLVALPVGGYFMLAPSQRRRLKRITRKQLGR